MNELFSPNRRGTFEFGLKTLSSNYRRAIAPGGVLEPGAQEKAVWKHGPGGPVLQQRRG